MSGLEIAGVVLGAIPLLIEALKIVCITRYQTVNSVNRGLANPSSTRMAFIQPHT